MWKKKNRRAFIPSGQLTLARFLHQAPDVRVHRGNGYKAASLDFHTGQLAASDELITEVAADAEHVCRCFDRH